MTTVLEEAENTIERMMPTSIVHPTPIHAIIGILDNEDRILLPPEGELLLVESACESEGSFALIKVSVDITEAGDPADELLLLVTILASSLRIFFSMSEHISSRPFIAADLIMPNVDYQCDLNS